VGRAAGGRGLVRGALHAATGAAFAEGAAVPACAAGPGAGCYYLVRQRGAYCNDQGLWTGCPNGPDDDGDACEAAQSNARETALP